MRQVQQEKQERPVRQVQQEKQAQQARLAPPENLAVLPVLLAQRVQLDLRENPVVLRGRLAKPGRQVQQAKLALPDRPEQPVKPVLPAHSSLIHLQSMCKLGQSVGTAHRPVHLKRYNRASQQYHRQEPFIFWAGLIRLQRQYR